MTPRITAKTHTSFWQTLTKPFFALAPMANVTDSVFRKIITKYGKPDVMWTEFVSADGLISAGQKRLLPDLKYSNKERPIVAQLFTGNPESMRKAAELVANLKFDGLDINMGCPDRSVQKQGGGAALMKQPEFAIEILRAARKGVKDSIQKAKRKKEKAGIRKRNIDSFKIGIPVSAKTRLGFNQVDLKWIRLLLEQKLPALTIHLRTRKEMSDVPAHWEIMPEIIRMRNEIQSDLKPIERTLIIGNGDVESIETGRDMATKYGCDGVMIGRGIFGKPWLFENIRRGDAKDRTPKQRLKILLEHAKSFEKTYCGKKHIKNFEVMKKHFKAYVSGWDGAKELRAKLMECESAKDVAITIHDSH